MPFDGVAQPSDSPDAGIPLRVHPGELREHPHHVGRACPGGAALVDCRRRHRENRYAEQFGHAFRGSEPSVAASGQILSHIRWDEKKSPEMFGASMRRIFVRKYVLRIPYPHVDMTFRRLDSRTLLLAVSSDLTFKASSTSWPRLLVYKSHSRQYSLVAISTSLTRARPSRSKVVGLDLDGPCIMLENGDIVDADLVVGADGYKGSVRSVVIDHEDNNDSVDTRFLQ